MTDNIDWNVIELTEIYESFDMVLRLLDVILEPINIKALYTQESETPKLKVAAYARVSTEQDEQQSSYEAQVDYYRKYICSNPEWKFVGIYADMKTPSLIQFNDLRRLAGRGGKLRGQGG